jgi:hypothetical protein
VGAWQRAGDWGLACIAAPLVGAETGPLSVDQSVSLLLETFPRQPADRPGELHIVVGAEAERDVVETMVRRMT